MKGSGLLIGGLAAVIALILFEQSQKPASAIAPASTPAPMPANSGVNTISGAGSPTATPAPTVSGANTAAQSLPQFSEVANVTIIDQSATPVFNGTSWTCPNGDLPYYDPSTQTVYCVLPGLTPNSVPPGDDGLILTYSD